MQEGQSAGGGEEQGEGQGPDEGPRGAEDDLAAALQVTTSLMKIMTEIA
jgi:hypothetical protein